MILRLYPFDKSYQYHNGDILRFSVKDIPIILTFADGIIIAAGVALHSGFMKFVLAVT
jgi:hypothetical protein